MWPDLDADEVLARVHARWDLSGPLPVPRPGWLVCPMCGSDEIQARFWRFHERSGSPTVRYRVDVSLKCCDCSACLPVFGVAVPDEWYEANLRKRGRNVHWREARQLFEGE